MQDAEGQGSIIKKAFLQIQEDNKKSKKGEIASKIGECWKSFAKAELSSTSYDDSQYKPFGNDYGEGEYLGVKSKGYLGQAKEYLGNLAKNLGSGLFSAIPVKKRVYEC